MAKLKLNLEKISDCRKLAQTISKPVEKLIASHSTIAIERTALRFLGVNGASPQAGGQFYPLANSVVDRFVQERKIADGVLIPFVSGMIQYKLGAEKFAEKISTGKIKVADIKELSFPSIKSKIDELCEAGAKKVYDAKKYRESVKSKVKDPFEPTGKNGPLLYVIVATGNIYDDVIQAKAAAQAGADAIAVIRSTAQSLLDYVPHGATTEGYGGTYATQENFRIMREALDEESQKLGRYIRLTNYCSGLCMPEIAALGALERLDFLLNDAMYGILFRDINMKRTLIDQHFSRKIIAASGIVIHTGEDNYLTTADAIENGHQVLASQFINECFALHAGMNKNQMGLGHAQEMNPEHPNVFLLEIARAQMTRQIFPEHPIKFMPPTRYKCGDIFYSHLMDAMFNFVGVFTGQTIQLLGMATEAMHTPLLQDRWMSIKNAKYIFNGAKDLGADLDFKSKGVIESWAEKVLNETHEHLTKIQQKGLFKAIEEKAFADVSRTETGGKGLPGVFERGSQYYNPFFELLK